MAPINSGTCAYGTRPVQVIQGERPRSAAEESREDLAKGDRASAAGRLHTLRGAAGYLGAADLVRAAQVFENAIKDQASGLEPLLNAFEQKLDMLLKASTPWRI